jgi:hypothetical protein
MEVFWVSTVVKIFAVFLWFVMQFAEAALCRMELVLARFQPR